MYEYSGLMRFTVDKTSGILLGYHAGRYQMLRPDTESVFRNVLALGPPGTGKKDSVLLPNLMMAIKDRRNIVLFTEDERLISEAKKAKEYGYTVYHLDFSNPEKSNTIDLLAEASKGGVSNESLHMTKDVTGSLGFSGQADEIDAENYLRLAMMHTMLTKKPISDMAYYFTEAGLNGLALDIESKRNRSEEYTEMYNRMLFARRSNNYLIWHQPLLSNFTEGLFRTKEVNLLSRKGISLDWLKTKSTAIIVTPCVGTELIVQMLIGVLARSAGRRAREGIFLFDNILRYGRIHNVNEKLYGTGSFTTLASAESIPAIKRVYGDAEQFANTFGVKVVTGCIDPDTATYLSERGLFDGTFPKNNAKAEKMKPTDFLTLWHPEEIIMMPRGDIYKVRKILESNIMEMNSEMKESYRRITEAGRL